MWIGPFSRLWTTVLAILVRCPIYPLLIPPSDLHKHKKNTQLQWRICWNSFKRIWKILTVFYHSLPKPPGSSGQGGSAGTTFKTETFLSFRVTLLLFHLLNKQNNLHGSPSSCVQGFQRSWEIQRMGLQPKSDLWILLEEFCTCHWKPNPAEASFRGHKAGWWQRHTAPLAGAGSCSTHTWKTSPKKTQNG